MAPPKTNKKTGAAASPIATLSNKVVAAAAVAVIALSFGATKLIQPTEEYNRMPSLDSYFTTNGFEGYGKSASVVFRNSNKAADSFDRNDVTVKVHKKINAHTDPIFAVPRSQIIDMPLLRESEVAKLLSYDNSSHIVALGDNSFQTVFYFSFFLMYERRRGKASTFYNWFQALPQSFEEQGGALYWPESVANCLDRMTQPEFVALQSVVGTTVQGANACCELPEEAIQGRTPCEDIIQRKANPFTEEEAKWAISVFLRYNYNDQILIPGLNFFKRSNRREGVYVQQSKTSQSVVILSPTTLKVTDEPIWNHPRSPGSALGIYGTFEGSQVIDLPYRLPAAKPKSLIRRLCHDQHSQLVFGANGRPRDAVIECFGALMSPTKEQKKHILNLRTREPRFYIDIYGNLTMLAHRHAMSIVNATKNDKCSLDGLSAPHRQAVLDYMKFSSTMFNTITEYLFQETNRLSAEEGLPPRFDSNEAAQAAAAEEQNMGTHNEMDEEWAEPEASP